MEPSSSFTIIKGNSEKVNITFFLNYSNYLSFKSFCNLKKYICSLKQNILLQIVFISTMNCDTFSVVPNVVNDSFKMCCQIANRESFIAQTQLVKKKNKK